MAIKWPMRVVSFKAYDEDIDQWKALAATGRITLGEWIRRRLNDGLATPLPLPREVEQRLPKPKAKPEKRVCEHRLPPGAYCKRCQVIKR